MKNKRIYRVWLYSVTDIVISLILTVLTFFIAKIILNYLYVNNEYEFVWHIWRFWRFIKYEFLDGFIAIIIGIAIFTIFYLLVTYKKAKSLAAIINETEIIAKGDLDRSIQVNFKGDMKVLAENINSISNQLKNRTIEERKAQKTKNDLITNVSHDLRTPLTSIKGYLGLINEDKYRDEVQLRYYVDIAYQ